MFYITVENNNLEFEGAKSVPVKGKGKWKQITGIFAVSATGRFLPMQLVYAGKSKRCHPQGIEFPSGFDVTHPLIHWSNEDLAIQLICEIILPYVDKIKEELGLPKNQKSLLIYDVFKEQTTKRYTDNGKDVYEADVDTRLSRMKPIHVHWIIGLCDKLWNSEKMIENGLKAVVITEALDPEKGFGDGDSFSHLI